MNKLFKYKISNYTGISSVIFLGIIIPLLFCFGFNWTVDFVYNQITGVSSFSNTTILILTSLIKIPGAIILGAFYGYLTQPFARNRRYV